MCACKVYTAKDFCQKLHILLVIMKILSKIWLKILDFAVLKMRTFTANCSADFYIKLFSVFLQSHHTRVLPSQRATIAKGSLKA